MKFSYKVIELPLGSRREFLMKPIIPVTLLHKNTFIRVEALIDSGADFTLFHKEIGDALGLKWESGEPHEFIGVTGKKGTAYFHTLHLKIGRWSKHIMCAFSDDLGEENYCILGQEGFFEYFKILFDLGKETITLQRK